MLLNWIAREGWVLPFWWLLVTMAAVAVFPLCVRLFGSLPDKGYTLSRAVGMLLVAFVYWLMASFGLVRNGVGGMGLAWLIVLITSLVIFRRGGTFDLRAYLRENRSVIVTAEMLFIVLFVMLVIYRAFLPDTSTTEKPMEMAFLSGIMRSETFPPNDAWLAGYSISYYHFGYIMAAMLSMLSGVNSGIGFSMTIALWFALTGLTVFGVAYNLVRSRAFDITRGTLRENAQGRFPAIISGILASVFVLLLSNFQLPLIELPYQSDAVPQGYFEFWGIQERSQFADGQYHAEGAFNPLATINRASSWDFWWWFRTSRVLTDYELNGQQSTHAQPIDEFPAFSFVLGDVHPHVLALPFVALAIGLALNIVLTWRAPNRYEILFYGIVIGGLMFLNTWDGPIYLVALIGAEALRRNMCSEGRLTLESWVSLFLFGVMLVAIALIGYLPFIIGFRTQASGFLPNLLYPTLFRQFFIMFAPLLLMVIPFLLVQAWQGNREYRMNWGLGIKVAFGLLFALIAAALFLTLIGLLVPSLRDVVTGFITRNGGWSVVLPQLLMRRLAYGLTTLVCLSVIAIIVARLFPTSGGKTNDENEAITYAPATGFALLLIGIAFSLTLLPEFVYLRDNFAVRINTIFKFYYQAWITLSLASSYAVYALLLHHDPRKEQHSSPVLRLAFGGMLIVMLILGLLYPILGMYSRAWIENGYHSRTADNPPVLTLDGRSSMPLSRDDYDAVICLDNLVTGDDAVVAEAVRDAYRSYYGRVGSITGIPIVMGWQNHQRQWRGGSYYVVDNGVGADKRADDLNELYSDLRWDVAIDIIKRHQIDYVFFGDTERQQYGSAGEDKFAENLDLVCEFGSSRVYHVTDDALIVNNQ
jgi:YYY domain-containing protein